MKKTESKIVEHGPDCRMCNERKMEVWLSTLSSWEKFVKEYEKILSITRLKTLAKF